MDDKKNKKLVIIIIMMLLIIIVMTGYIVYDGVTNKGNKLSDKSFIDKDSTQEESLTPINTKYKDLEFVRTTKLECVSFSGLEGISEKFSMGCFNAKIENGTIIFEDEKGQKFVSEEIDNFKYITKFNNFMHEVNFSDFAALTTSGNLYILSGISEKDRKVYFNKINYDKKIYELFVSNESDGTNSGLLYVLNEQDELLEYNSSMKNRYEERTINLVGCGGGHCYRGDVSLVDKQGRLEGEIIKFDKQALKIKYMFETNYDQVYELYIVTHDNKIFTTKRKMDLSIYNEENGFDQSIVNEWYQIILYKNLEVKSVSYNRDVVTITYKNGTTEKINNMYELIDLEKNYGYSYSYYLED